MNNNLLDVDPVAAVVTRLELLRDVVAANNGHCKCRHQKNVY